MKSFTFAVVFVVLATGTLAIPAPEGDATSLEKKSPSIVQYDQSFGSDNSEWVRQKKSYGAQAAPAAYGAPAAYSAPAAPQYAPSSLTYSAPGPAIPCSKAVIVSCAPSVISAPCSAPAAGGY